METMQNIFQAAITQKIGWTLVHFVWQAFAIALLLAVLLKLLRNSSAHLRYLIACGGLALMVCAPVITLQMIPTPENHPTPAVQPPADLSDTDAATPVITDMPDIEIPPVSIAPAASALPWQDRFTHTLGAALPYIVAGWLAGVLGLSLWYLGGWTQLQKFRRRMIQPVSPELKAKLHQLAGRLAIRQSIDLFESALVQVPAVVGHLKPAILLPASALTGLSPQQIEVILAHELAHIKRHDYLVNMLQTAVEILGFYHPAVWWVSHRIRIERENCCDDLAVSVCQDRLFYAKALTTMAEIRAARSAFALTISGPTLFDRIRRLLGKDSPSERKSSWLPSVMAILLIAVCIIASTLAFDNKSGETATDLKIVSGQVFADETGEPIKNALVRVAIPATDMRQVRVSTDRKIYETFTDSNGDFKLEFVPDNEEDVSVDVFAPGFRSAAGTFRSGPDDPKLRKLQLYGSFGRLRSNLSISLPNALYISGIIETVA